MTIFVRDDVITEFRRDRMPLIRGYLPKGISVDDDYIWRMVLAAEADIKRRLHVFLEPTHVFAGEPTQQELDAIGDEPYVVEPQYDYSPDMFSTAWGALVARNVPVISVSSIVFEFPAPNMTPWVVPPTWIRVDPKTGLVQLVPAGVAMASSLTLFLFRLVGGGTNIPAMLHVRYLAGLKDVATNYPDLISLIMRGASLRIMQDQFVPQSTSLSADGLSRTKSSDVDKYQDAYEKAIGDLRDEILGPQFTVC